MKNRQYLALGVLLVAAAGVLLMPHQPQARSLSLVFERYGTTTDFAFNNQDVAFFWLTNTSDKSFALPMAGSTNTFWREPALGFDRGSYLIRWEFSDQPDPQPPVSLASLGLCLTVAPHSAVRVRVPLPPQGQIRRVAVLCAEVPSPGRPFWTHGIGLSMLRTLPHSVRLKLLFSQPAVLRVWSDRELSGPGERLTK